MFRVQGFGIGKGILCNIRLCKSLRTPARGNSNFGLGLGRSRGCDGDNWGRRLAADDCDRSRRDGLSGGDGSIDSSSGGRSGAGRRGSNVVGSVGVCNSARRLVGRALLDGSKLGTTSGNLSLAFCNTLFRVEGNATVDTTSSLGTSRGAGTGQSGRSNDGRRDCSRGIGSVRPNRSNARGCLGSCLFGNADGPFRWVKSEQGNSLRSGDRSRSDGSRGLHGGGWASHGRGWQRSGCSIRGRACNIHKRSNDSRSSDGRSISGSLLGTNGEREISFVGNWVGVTVITDNENRPVSGI